MIAKIDIAISLMTYYLARKLNVTRSVSLRIVFNIWEKGKWAFRLEPVQARGLHVRGNFWFLVSHA